MARATTELVLFVASPGDCDVERARVRKVADEVSNTLGAEHGVHIRVSGWEHVTSDAGRPQDLINPQVDECDIFVGILGYRWGSDTGTHSSGFSEEYERAIARRANEALRVAVYFRSVPAEMERDPGTELQKVRSFQAILRDEHSLLYSSFTDPTHLETLLWPMLVEEVTRISRVAAITDEASASSAGAAEPPPDGENALDGEVDAARAQIAEISEALALAAATGDGRTVDHDRLLLIALGLNDDAGILPGHVANRVFLRRSDLAISVMESSLWLRSCLSDIGTSSERSARVVPGWAMVALDETAIASTVRSADGEAIAGLFRTLSELDVRPACLWQSGLVELAASVELWELALAELRARSAAVDYLADQVEPDDASLVLEIAKASGNQDLEQLYGLLTGSPSDAARAVATEYSSPKWKLDRVITNVDYLADEELEAIALSKRRSSEVRCLAMRYLERRGPLRSEIIEKAILDGPAAELLFEWAEGVDSNLTVEDLAQAVESIEDDRLRSTDVPARLRSLTESASSLEELMGTHWSGIDSWIALSWTGADRVVERAREILDTDAEALLEPYAALISDPSDDDIFAFVRSKARLAATRVLSRSSDLPDDRSRVAREVERRSEYHLEQVIRIWAPRAGADDLPLIRELLAERGQVARGTLEEAVLRVVGADGARELLSAPMRDISAGAVVSVLGADPSTPDWELIDLLWSKDADVRIAAVDALERRFDRQRLDALLAVYPHEKESYWYNVVVELDWLLNRPTDLHRDPTSIEMSEGGGCPT